MFEQIVIFLSDKIENMLKLGKYTRINGSDAKLQEIQIKTLRNIEDALKVGQFGFNSKAPLGSRCVVARIGNESVIVANEHVASIIDVDSGDSIIYNENGDYVKVEKDIITVFAKKIVSNCDEYEINASSKFTVNTPDANFNGGTVKNDGISIDKEHTHSQPSDSGGNTEAETNPPS